VAGHDPLDRAPSDEAALQQIGQELDGPLFLELTTPEERRCTSGAPTSWAELVLITIELGR